MKLDKSGKPAVMITVKGFDVTARFNAQAAGLPDLPIVALPGALVPPEKVMDETQFGEKIAAQVIEALTSRTPSVAAEATEEVSDKLTFSGKDYPNAAAKMEQYFLQHRWSDGFPMVPPTGEAVEKMLEGTDLARDHVVAMVEPAGGIATVEKIAINAVMAGCLPQYMPVLIAAVEAITDPRFDLRGFQCTAGLGSPLLIISGPKVIEQLNINDSYSTIGPGWRANSTIGRALRLMMINIGQTWPGKPDMKQLGTPFKFITLMAENESAYQGAWEPLRVTEGFTADQVTVSVMPATSWNPITCNPDIINGNKLVDYVCYHGKAKYDNNVGCWGMDNLLLLTPSTFTVICKEGLSRTEMQQKIYDQLQAPAERFFEGRSPELSATHSLTYRIPEWFARKYKEDPQTPLPLLRAPEKLRIIGAGADGPSQMCYVGTWLKSAFVTKEVRLPGNWENLLEKHSGWDTPIARPEKSIY